MLKLLRSVLASGRNFSWPLKCGEKKEKRRRASLVQSILLFYVIFNTFNKIKMFCTIREHDLKTDRKEETHVPYRENNKLPACSGQSNKDHTDTCHVLSSCLSLRSATHIPHVTTKNPTLTTTTCVITLYKVQIPLRAVPRRGSPAALRTAESGPAEGIWAPGSLGLCRH